jgi:hypothetical protein
MDSDKQSPIKIDKRKTMPHLWKKGQSGNILGRPKGKTMKEWARDYLERMNDDERDEFMEGIPKDIIWKMSEGNPQTNTDLTTNGKELPQPIINVSRDDSV